MSTIDDYEYGEKVINRVIYDFLNSSLQTTYLMMSQNLKCLCNGLFSLWVMANQDVQINNFLLLSL